MKVGSALVLFVNKFPKNTVICAHDHKFENDERRK